MKLSLLKSYNDITSKTLHEIRNILTLVQGNLQIIESDHPLTKSFRNWDQLQIDLHMMGDLLQNLSCTDGFHVLTLVRGNLLSTIESVVRTFQWESRKRGVSLRIIIDSKAKEYASNALLDPKCMKQALVNLIKNAIEACSEGNEILIMLDQEVIGGKKYLVLDVMDDGAGIPMEELNNIFEMNYTTKENGTGLGLPIVKEIIDLHGGEIYAESEPGRTIFRVMFPMK